MSGIYQTKNLLKRRDFLQRRSSDSLSHLDETNLSEEGEDYQGYDSEKKGESHFIATHGGRSRFRRHRLVSVRLVRAIVTSTLVRAHRCFLHRGYINAYARKKKTGELPVSITKREASPVFTFNKFIIAQKMPRVNMFIAGEFPYTKAIFDCGRNSRFSAYEGNGDSDRTVFCGGGSRSVVRFSLGVSRCVAWALVDLCDECR